MSSRAVWVNPEASDEQVVFDNNRAATLEALRAGRAGHPSVAAPWPPRDDVHNAYFRP